MNRFYSLSLLFLVFILSACSERGEQTEAVDIQYRDLEWTELIPDDDLQALMNPPSYLDFIEDGSEEDKIDGLKQASPITETPDRYQQALVSVNVKEEFNEQKVRIPGFVVPLEFNDNNVVTTFFLVPFFGACTHEPAPPPNQIIYSEFEPGKKLDDLYEPVWLTGTLHTSTISNELATSAYSMIVDSITLYE